MEFFQSIQRALDFMEANILEDIGYEDVALHLNMSNYHFHRTFTMFLGITPNEYMKKRRLSMAGQEISMSNEKVIDIAYKYRYGTPESFTKAFTRYHGITPSVARRSGASLKAYNPLSIKIELEGGAAMDYRIEKREGFKLLAKVRDFDNERVSQDGNEDIPNFWKECGENGIIKELLAYSYSGDVYGACAPISKESRHFDYGIGVRYKGEEEIQGYRIWDVEPTVWAVFKCIGDDGECIGDTWNGIFKEFLPNSDYEMLDSTDFELYSDDLEAGCFCEIWIPVKKK